MSVAPAAIADAAAAALGRWKEKKREREWNDRVKETIRINGGEGIEITDEA